MRTLMGTFGRPTFLRGFHGWMTAGWGAAIPITIFTDLKTSLTWIALMSVWANFVGHFSSWQAARVEVKQDEQIDSVTLTASENLRDATGRFEDERAHDRDVHQD